MVEVFGDLHISDANAWSVQASKLVIDYVLKSVFNTAQNSVIFLGDITHNKVASGKVIELMDTLIKGLKYDSVYVVMGNHEGKIEKDEVVLTYQYWESFPNVHIIKEAGHHTIEGIDFMVLPYVYPVKDNYSLASYEALTDSCDVLIGHYTDSELPIYSADKIKINIKAKEKVLGHIHSGEYLSFGYIGSMYAVSISESGVPRYKTLLTKENNTIIRKDIPLPQFVEYKEVVLGDPLPQVQQGQVQILKIKNCANEELAKNYYKDDNLFILSTTYAVNDNDLMLVADLQNASLDEDVKSVLQEYFTLKEVGPALQTIILTYLGLISQKAQDIVSNGDTQLKIKRR